MYGSQRPAGPARPVGLVRLAKPVTDLLLIMFVAQQKIFSVRGRLCAEVWQKKIVYLETGLPLTWSNNNVLFRFELKIGTRLFDAKLKADDSVQNESGFNYIQLNSRFP